MAESGFDRGTQVSSVALKASAENIIWAETYDERSHCVAGLEEGWISPSV